jgi:topoisomerase IV subunit A
MEALFRQTDLEVRIPLNLNVLDADGTPRVLDLRQALKAFLDHRHVVLVRRTKNRLEKIERRLEILAGYLIAYRNLDEVIRIIREEEDPKPVLMKRFKLTDIQAEAILNMRLRALRKLEELAIRKEHKELSAERTDLVDLLAKEPRRWQKIAEEIGEVKKRFAANSPLGRRRTEIADAPAIADVPLEAMVEREPVTVICSDKGWIRVAKGHVENEADIKYKEGDHSRFVLRCETTDRLLIFASNGRFYSLPVDKLPGGRGFGEPLRLMIDIPNEHDIVQVMVHRPDGGRLLVASDDGRGFVVEESEVVAQTRAGKQVLTLGEGARAVVAVPVVGDAVATIGENRKLLIFRLDEVPVMSRGRGVTLQKYRDGGLSDAVTFSLKDGLSWRQAGGRTRTESDLGEWIGKRAQAGRLPPRGFPGNNKFNAI